MHNDRGEHEAFYITDDDINYCLYASLLKFFLTCYSILCSNLTAVLAQRASWCSRDDRPVLKNGLTADIGYFKARGDSIHTALTSEAVTQQMSPLVTATVGTAK